MESSGISLTLAVAIVSFVYRPTAGTHSADPMCSNDYTGGLGCNFERGVCGGVLTEHDRTRWVWAHTQAGPIKTHVDSRESTASQGHYIYLDAHNTPVHTASLELFLSPDVTSFCLLLHYATTGNDSLVLRVIAQHQTGNTLLDEKEVQTFNQWEQLFLPLCLVGNQRSFILLEIEGFSENQTIAFDHIEITRSLRTCDGNAFSLQCSRDLTRHAQTTQDVTLSLVDRFSFWDHHQLANDRARMGNDKDVPLDQTNLLDLLGSEHSRPLDKSLEQDGGTGCHFKSGLCEGMSLGESDIDGARWVLSNTAGDGSLVGIGDDKWNIGDPHLYLEAADDTIDGDKPARLILALPTNASDGIRLSIGYIISGDMSGDSTMRVYLKQSHRTTFLTETPRGQVGANMLDLVLDCCVGAGGTDRQIIIEAGYGKISPTSTLAIFYVDFGESSNVCPSDRPGTTTQAIPSSTSTEDQSEDITGNTTELVTPSLSLRTTSSSMDDEDVIGNTGTTEVTPPTSPGTTQGSMNDEDLIVNTTELVTPPISIRTTSGSMNGGDHIGNTTQVTPSTAPGTTPGSMDDEDVIGNTGTTEVTPPTSPGTTQGSMNDEDLIVNTTEVTLSTSLVKKSGSMDPEDILENNPKPKPSTIPLANTSSAIHAANQGLTSDGLSGDVIGIIASCVSVVVILVFSGIGFLVWRRRRSTSRNKAGSQKQILFRASGNSRAPESTVSTAAENPIYGSHAMYGEQDSTEPDIEEPVYSEPDEIKASPVLVMTNQMYGGITKA